METVLSVLCYEQQAAFCLHDIISGKNGGWGKTESQRNIVRFSIRYQAVAVRSLLSEIGFCMASCSYRYIDIYICMYVYIIIISVKMAAPWGSLTLLSYYSLCPHVRSH